MDEKQPSFTVTDRRKFTLDGELRDDAPAEPEGEKVTSSSSRDGAAAKPANGGAASVATEPKAEKPADNVVRMPAPPTMEDAAAEPEPEPEMPQFSAKETEEQDAAYQESSRQIDDMLRQANPGMGATGTITFEHVIQSFYVSSMIAMGAGTEPGQKARIDILGARQSIDMLALLQDKTKGNLTQKEEAMLQNVLFELRMMFLEITNAIAQQAQRPGDGKVR